MHGMGEFHIKKVFGFGVLLMVGMLGKRDYGIL